MPMNPTLHKALLMLILAMAIVLTNGCATPLLQKPQAPIVKVISVRPLNFSFVEQRLAFKLQVSNPNSYDLPIQRLEFIASLDKEKIANGETQEAVTLPANGSTTMQIEVKAGVNKLVSQLQNMLSANSLSLDYDIKGWVKLANWPSKIPFDVEGVLEPQDSPKEQGERV